MPKESLILLDVHGLIYRAYYAVKNLTNSKGQSTNAVFGFCNILRKLLQDLKPTHIAACFDPPEKTLRHEAYAQYKAHRQKMPDDLVTQIPLISQVVEAYRIPICQWDGYEADDVIATLAKRFASKELDVIIVTQDKDMGQLVGGPIKIYNTQQEKMLGSHEIEEKFGVKPPQIVDYLSLVGDSSDNIPGVAGIGEVGARKLLAQFKSIDDIYSHIDAVTPEKMRANLIQGKSEAYLSRELATLHVDLKLPWSKEDIKIAESDKNKLFDLFTSLEFKKFAAELKEQESQVVVDVADEKIDFVRHVKLHVAGKEVQVVYDLKELYAAHIKHDRDVFDVFLAGYLLGGGKDKYDLTSLSWQYLSTKPTADVIKDLYVPMRESLEKQGMWELYHAIELPLVDVLWRMEQNGVKINTQVLEGLSAECKERMLTLEEELYKSAGLKFNLNSPKQLSEVLFDRLKLPVIKKTKTGNSTDEEVLTKLSSKHPLPAMILEYRQLAKLKNTYIDALPGLVNPTTHRIHAHFNQTGAETGRLSSNNPNLQNIPIRTELGKKIRGAFVAYHPDELILSADYSQIELRILAHLADDDGLKKAFATDQDIHRYTASLMFDVAEKDVDDQMRYAAKRINFGIIYGMSAFGLAKDLNVSNKEAQEFIEKYFIRYPNVQGYLDNEIQKARTQGYVSTMFGRRRYLPDIHNRNMALRQFAERQAINAPIQGSAADIIKKAMVQIDVQLTRRKLASVMIMSVHDELVFNVPMKEKEEMIDLVRSQMENVVSLSVPIKASVKMGSNWLEMKSL